LFLVTNFKLQYFNSSQNGLTRRDIKPQSTSTNYTLFKSQILNYMWKFCRLIILQYIFRNLYRHEKFEASTKDYCLGTLHHWVWQKCFVVKETAASVVIHPNDGGSRFLWNTGTLNNTRLKSITSQTAVNFYRHCLKNKTETSYVLMTYVHKSALVVILCDFHNFRNIKHVNR
jgi:hypothetical protein